MKRMMIVLGMVVALFAAMLPAMGTGNYEEEPEVDVCDPSQKPGGVGIAEWLDAEGFEASDCFEFTVGQDCGVLDVSLTRNDTPYSYVFLWNYGAAPDLGAAQSFPASFDEDEGDGSVEVTYYVAGPESDYFVGYGIPNFWEGGATITIETDCEPDETTTTTVPEETTTTAPDETVPAVPPTGSIDLVCADEGGLVATIEVDEESEAGYHVVVTVNDEITEILEFIGAGDLAIDAPEAAFVSVELIGGDERLDFVEVTVDCEDEVSTPTTQPDVVEELPFTGPGPFNGLVSTEGLLLGGSAAVVAGLVALAWGARKEEDLEI